MRFGLATGRTTSRRSGCVDWKRKLRNEALNKLHGGMAQASVPLRRRDTYNRVSLRHDRERWEDIKFIFNATLEELFPIVSVLHRKRISMKPKKYRVIMTKLFDRK